MRKGTESFYGPITSRWGKRGDKVSLKVSIPPNSQATVFVPVKDQDAIEEGGKKLIRVDGVKFLRKEGNCTVISVESGRYEFQFTAASLSGG